MHLIARVYVEESPSEKGVNISEYRTHTYEVPRGIALYPSGAVGLGLIIVCMTLSVRVYVQESPSVKDIRFFLIS